MSHPLIGHDYDEDTTDEARAELMQNLADEERMIQEAVREDEIEKDDSNLNDLV